MKVQKHWVCNEGINYEKKRYSIGIIRGLCVLNSVRLLKENAETKLTFSHISAGVQNVLNVYSIGPSTLLFLFLNIKHAIL